MIASLHDRVESSWTWAGNPFFSSGRWLEQMVEAALGHQPRLGQLGIGEPSPSAVADPGLLTLAAITDR
jgi:hypothetical protein